MRVSGELAPRRNEKEDLAKSSMIPFVLALAVDSSESPHFGWGESELEKGVLEFYIPLNLLPSFIPPRS
jgi:hypothetical protein